MYSAVNTKLISGGAESAKRRYNGKILVLHGCIKEYLVKCNYNIRLDRIAFTELIAHNVTY